MGTVRHRDLLIFYRHGTSSGLFCGGNMDDLQMRHVLPLNPATDMNS